MRPLVLFLLAVCLGVGACHKTTPRPPDSLIGQWKWVAMDWVFGPGRGVAHPGPDTTIVLVLGNTGHFQLLLNNKQQLDSTYTTQQNDRILFNEQWTPSNSAAAFGLGNEYAYAFHGDTLLLGNNDLALTPAGASDTLKFIPYP